MVRKPRKSKPRVRKSGTADAATMSPEEFTGARLALDLYQREFAEELGIGKTAVYLKERGDLNVSKAESMAIELLLRRAKKWPLKET